MQNKGFIRVVAVLLTLICLFYLSFSVVTAIYNNKAKEYAAGAVGVHERQVQHSGGEPHEGERARGAAQARRLGRAGAALHGDHLAVRRGAVFARGIGADERCLFGGCGPDLPYRGGHKAIVL